MYIQIRASHCMFVHMYIMALIQRSFLAIPTQGDIVTPFPFYPFALNPICFVYIYESTNEAQTQIHRGASTPAAYCAAQPPFDCAVSFCVIVASAAPEPARSGISVAVVATG